MNTTYVCIILKCGEMSEQVRENACVHARLCVLCVCLYVATCAYVCTRKRNLSRFDISQTLDKY